MPSMPPLSPAVPLYTYRPEREESFGFCVVSFKSTGIGSCWQR